MSSFRVCQSYLFFSSLIRCSPWWMIDEGAFGNFYDALLSPIFSIFSSSVWIKTKNYDTSFYYRWWCSWAMMLSYWRKKYMIVENSVLWSVMSSWSYCARWTIYAPYLVWWCSIKSLSIGMLEGKKIIYCHSTCLCNGVVGMNDGTGCIVLSSHWLGCKIGSVCFQDKWCVRNMDETFSQFLRFWVGDDACDPKPYSIGFLTDCLKFFDAIASTVKIQFEIKEFGHHFSCFIKCIPWVNNEWKFELACDMTLETKHCLLECKRWARVMIEVDTAFSSCIQTRIGILCILGNIVFDEDSTYIVVLGLRNPDRMKSESTSQSLSVGMGEDREHMCVVLWTDSWDHEIRSSFLSPLVDKVFSLQKQWWMVEVTVKIKHMITKIKKHRLTVSVWFFLFFSRWAYHHAIATYWISLTIA